MLMPLWYEVFEADEVEEATHDHQPAGPGTTEPVIHYDNALPNDHDDQRDMENDDP
jgi:hypothetical protein